MERLNGNSNSNSNSNSKNCLDQWVYYAQIIDTSHLQLCARTSSNIMSNWSPKPNVSQQFDFRFVWINEFTMAAQRIDTQHHQLCARTLSNIMSNWSMKPKRVPQQFDFTAHCVFLDQWIHCGITNDWHLHHQLCALTSLNIILNWYVKPNRCTQQFDFTTQYFVWEMNLLWHD